MTTGAAVRVRFVDVLSVREFRALWLAQVLSLVGDQLARVALSVLVFHATGSALLTGFVYALGFLPAALGGPLLGGLADRRPRRDLMITCDVVRAALVVAMALSGRHLLLLCCLLVAAELLSAPFGAARAALLAEVLQGEHYLVGSAIGNVTAQSAQVLGFALGGGLVAVVGSSPALLVDAATFGASAVLLRIAVAARPAPLPRISPRGPRDRALAQAALTQALAASRRTTRYIAADPHLRLLVLLALLCGCYAVPEGLAAPYAADLHGGPGTVGLLLAAQPVGAALGAVLLARLVPPGRRQRVMAPLAALACAPLLVLATGPGLRWTLLLLAASGVGQAYQLVANAAFVSAVPDDQRGQAFGLVQSAILVVQGGGFLVAGAAADLVPPGQVGAAAGAVGLLVLAAVLASCRRTAPRHT